MPTAIAPDARRIGRLEYLPVALFGSVMGLTGLSVAWSLAADRFGLPHVIAQVIAVLACLTFVAVGSGYLVKAVTAFDRVRSEFEHPIAGSLFGTIFISLLLLPIVIAPWSLALARSVWILGAVGMAVFAVVIVRRWTRGEQDATHATPPWIVPVVGMLDIPLAVPSLHLAPLREAMLPGLAIGLFFAIPLLTLIFSRLVFQAALPLALQPTLFILLAPFSVGVSAYVTTTGNTDAFAQGLYAISLFLLAVLANRFRYLGSCCPFRTAWWAVSFPLAATAIAALRVDGVQGTTVTGAVAIALLACTTAFIAYLFGRTWIGVARGELRALAA